MRRLIALLAEGHRSDRSRDSDAIMDAQGVARLHKKLVRDGKLSNAEMKELRAAMVDAAKDMDIDRADYESIIDDLLTVEPQD